ncbi:MAG: MFS transporter [Dysgonamonadaceae bacterium]|jgi:EmrB/QacA subfamily drug resistance transporter|nr:MFS transporter [Dysgonamonadaceae bacterium]
MGWSNKQLSVLGVVSTTSFMGTFLISSINIALPAIEKSFGMNAVELSWVITSFLLATALFMLPVGRWGDTSGNSRLFKTGLIIFTAASLFCALAPSGKCLIAARFIQGIGMAFSNTTGSAILVSNFPAKNRGQVIGISVASVYIGLALGPFVGGIITQHLGWHTLFYLSFVLGLTTTVIAFVFLKKEAVHSGVSIKQDWRGIQLFMLGLIALVYGSSVIPALYGWALMLGGIALISVFWLLEGRTEFPMLDTKLYTQNKLFAYSNLAALINYTSTFAIVFFLSFYLQKIKGFEPQKAGVIIIAQPVMMAVFSPIIGRWADKIQPRYFATTGMTICSIGLAALAFLSERTPIGFIIAILIWVGMGFALFSSPNMTTIMSSVDKSRYGQASGSAASMRVFGQIISMTIATLYISFLFGGQSIEDVSHGDFLTVMKWGFITFAIIGICGIYFSMARGNVERG